jgi:hypothetical protein
MQLLFEGFLKSYLERFKGSFGNFIYDSSVRLQNAKREGNHFSIIIENIYIIFYKVGITNVKVYDINQKLQEKDIQVLELIVNDK